MPPTKSSYRWWILALSALGTLMVILDSSIVNVALPYMMSAFGVNRDQIEWVSNSFMLATAVAMPLTGWIVTRFTYRAYFLASLFLFTLGSALCAVAWSYDALVFARVLQAVGGGGIQPLGMAMIGDLFGPEERGKAMGVWGMGIVIGPAVGPTLGGYLTEWFSWRAIFAVNLPIGAAAILLGFVIIRANEIDREHRPTFDGLGFAFLTMFLIAALLGATNGQEKGWDSDYVTVCAICAIIGFVMFLGVEASVKHPLLDLKLFSRRNYSLSMVLMVVRSIGLFGSIFLLPFFLENIVGYTTIQTGLWMAPGALAVGACMPVAGRLADRLQPKWLMAAGSAIAGYSMLLYGHLDPRTDALGIIGPQLLRGIGMALMMAPMMAVALNAVPKKSIATAASFLNIGSRVGGALGIALLNTIVTNEAHLHAVRLGGHMPVESRGFARLASRAGHAELPGSSRMPHSDAGKGLVVLARATMQRAQVLAFDNGFVLGGLILIGTGIPLSAALAREAHLGRKGRGHPAARAGRSDGSADVD